MKCQNCEQKFDINKCEQDTYQGITVNICPNCKHGNY